MKRTLPKTTIVLSAVLLVGMLPRLRAAEYAGYRVLDQGQPVSFDGATVR